MAYEGFRVLNASAAAFATQARVFDQDFQILADGARGHGVIYTSGACLVTQRGAGANMSVDVAAGLIYFNGTAVAVTSGNVAITAADATNPRIDVVSVSNTGTKTVTAGTAAAAPSPPTIPQSVGVNNIVLAFVHVPAGDTAVTTNQIADKRCYIGGLNTQLRVTSDVINATASFADVTGLTCPVESGKHYNFTAHLYHLANATTNGARFGINGPTMTGMRIQEIDVKTASATSAVLVSNDSDVTTRDAASITELDSSTTPVLAILSGWINPSAAGTFAVRCAAETAVAAALTIKTGSWCRIWEAA